VQRLHLKEHFPPGKAGFLFLLKILSGSLGPLYDSGMTTEHQELIDKFLAKPSSVREKVVLKSCDMSKEDGQSLFDKINYWVSFFFGRFWNLELLEEIVISPNYHSALSQVDLGYQRPQPLTATNDRLTEGVAMAIPVIRDGKVAMHLVLNANIMAPLLDEENEHFILARSILAHECAHIHDLAEKHRAFPNELLQYVTSERFGTRDFQIQQIAFACWIEYAACRLAVDWTPENEIPILEHNLRSVLEGIDHRIKQHHREYTEPRHLLRLFNAIFLEVGNLAKYASYLLGHLDGIEQDCETAAPATFALIQATPFFVPLFDELKSTLQTMWDSYGEWSSYKIFGRLEQFAENILMAGGVLPEDVPEGLYIHVRSIS
jgi:hypothetical protein